MKNAFVSGLTCATRAVADLMDTNIEFYRFVCDSVDRHMMCDWGDLCDDDKQMNDLAVESGEDRILSCYLFDGHPDWKIWIITEADRSTTTVLFPDEY